MQKLLAFFQQKYKGVCHFNDQSFNDTLTNNIVSFEQLGLDIFIFLRKNTSYNIRKCAIRYGRSVKTQISLHNRAV